VDSQAMMNKNIVHLQVKSGDKGFTLYQVNILN